MIMLWLNKYAIEELGTQFKYGMNNLWEFKYGMNNLWEHLSTYFNRFKL